MTTPWATPGPYRTAATWTTGSPRATRPRQTSRLRAPPWPTTPMLGLSWSSVLWAPGHYVGQEAARRRRCPWARTWTFQTAATGYRMVAADGGVFEVRGTRSSGRPAVCSSTNPSWGWASAPGGDGYWLVASRRRGVQFRPRRRVPGSMGGGHRSTGPSWGRPPIRPPAATGWWPPTAGCSASMPSSSGRPDGTPLNQPIVGMGVGAGWQWLLAGRQGRGCLQLRIRSRLPGVDGWHGRSTSPSWGWPPIRPPAATGWWPPTAGCSASMPPFFGSTGGIYSSTNPSWGWPAAPGGNGYWLVAKRWGRLQLRPRSRLPGFDG